MELKEFVTKTILDIVDGVQDAHDQCKTGAEIVSSAAMTEKIDFDIELTAVKGANGDITIGVGLPIAKTGGLIRAGLHKSESTRVRFSVPIKYPKWTPVRTHNDTKQ